MRQVLVLIGPTASGKTQISLLIAKQINAEILSADSRQIYRYMDIGTAKPALEFREKIKHYFVDELNPDQDFNAGEFGRKGREIIEHIFRRNKIPLIVGGSGLYVRALIDGFFNGPSADKSVRRRLYDELKREGPEKLLADLKKVDPVTANGMLPSNKRRIARALEVYRLTGIPISKLKENRIEINFIPYIAGLRWDRKVLYERIDSRVKMMIENGLIDEVKKMRVMGYSKGLNSLETVGYKEVIDYLDGNINFDKMIELIQRNSRRYAKRQLTWFRPDRRIHWFDLKSDEDFTGIASEICRCYVQRAV